MTQGCAKVSLWVRLSDYWTNKQNLTYQIDSFLPEFVQISAAEVRVYVAARHRSWGALGQTGDLVVDYSDVQFPRVSSNTQVEQQTLHNG